MAKLLSMVLAVLMLGVSAGRSAAKERDARREPTRVPKVRVGDMLLAPGQVTFHDGDETAAGRAPQPRGHVKLGIHPWPDGIIPIKFAFGVTADLQERFIDACDKWAEAGVRCIRRTESDDVYVKVKWGEGCWSEVGYPTPGPLGFIPWWEREREISLGAGCWSEGVIVHEIGHTLGLLHEHMREDRDQYIEILWENIADDKEDQYRRLAGRTYGLPYDFDSVMHYWSGAFDITPKDSDDLDTFIGRAGCTQEAADAGSRQRPSGLDLLTIQMLYGSGSLNSVVPPDDCRASRFARR